MTLRQWRFSGFEFLTLWEQMDRDRLPYPLMYQPTAPTVDEHNAERSLAAQSLAGRVDAHLRAGLTVLAEPAVRVELVGVHDTGARVRAHAGIASATGIVVEQLPGTDEMTGGDVIVHVGAAEIVGRALAAALPLAQAGRTRGVSVHQSDLDHQQGQSFMQNARETSPKDQYRAFFKRTRNGVGRIDAFVGPAYDARPTNDGAGFYWMDYADDGRYLVHKGHTITAVPASAETVASHVDQLIARTRQRVARV